MKLAAVVGVAAVLLGKARRRDSMKAMLLAVGPSASAMMYRASRSDARTIDASYVTSAPALVPLKVLNMSGEFGTTAAPLCVASVAGAPVVALIGCGTRASSSARNGVLDIDATILADPAAPARRSAHRL